jgi:hypothetical protein
MTVTGENSDNDIDVSYNCATIAKLEESYLMSNVTVAKGTAYKFNIENQTFPLVAPYKAYSNREGGFVTVQGDILGPEFCRKIRISVMSPDDVKYEFNGDVIETSVAKPVETDEQIMARISERFEILDAMTEAAAAGDIRAMIVVGPPGVGKSFGVIKKLDECKLFDTMQNLQGYEIVKGNLSALGLYAKLYEFREAGKVIVFDDCDNILQEEDTLNILKHALDNGKKRIISWNTDSNYLRREGIPNKFDFDGAVIFITNISFDNVRSQKTKDHLKALESRCHFIDLTMNSRRDCFLRIRQVADEGKLFKGYNFTSSDEEEVLNFIQENEPRLREVSLRTATKIADLKKSVGNWKRVAQVTVMK